MKKITPYQPESYSPVPTKFVQFLRVNFFWQIIRFLVLNIRMLKMVRKH